jgi:hypothetical protein
LDGFAGSLIEHLLLRGFEFEDHGRSYETDMNPMNVIFFARSSQFLTGYGLLQLLLLASFAKNR